ncbi:hypothetical protein Tco_1469789, partial [Tanacetum coccineum]
MKLSLINTATIATTVITASQKVAMFSLWTGRMKQQVRILQKSQENGQSRTNTDTGMDKSAQEPGECYQ